jgi:4-hydroxybenzoate polyprenyltransferase
MSALLASVRPKQWTKNLIIFLPVAFTLNLSWDPEDLGEVGSLLGRVGAAFGLFCLLSSAVYLINDLADLESDRRHPRKRFRPLASGRLNQQVALGTALAFLGAGLPVAFSLDLGFGFVALAYVGLMALYIVLLRNLVILDVFTIAAGFVIRAVAGAVVIDVTPSPWLYIVTALGAMFIGLAKRRHELLLLGEDGGGHRESLEHYTPQMLDHMITMLMPSTLIAYILYTFTAENLPSNNAMMLTIPFVAYGIFRYFYLIHAKNAGGNPEDILIKDIPILVTIALWLATTVAVLWAYRD